MSGTSETFTVATYNIHRGWGTDGAYDPRRIAQVLGEIDADVIGLQEVDTSLMVPPGERRRAHGQTPGPVRGRERHQLDFLSEVMNVQAVAGPVVARGTGHFGNALLTRHPVQAVRHIDLSVRGGIEKRGALDVDVSIRGRPVRIVVTHLGLPIWERHFQVARLLKALGDGRAEQLVLVGDFNLLLALGTKLRRFYRRLGPAPLLTTFPARFPLLPLDRIWSQPARALIKLVRHQTPVSCVASDHLPLIGTFRLD